jgi:RNA-directed DNA polymerase
VHRLLRQGFTDVVDAGLSKYFDTIPHDELLRSIAARLVEARPGQHSTRGSSCS